jgi:hypothetical protein
MLRARPYLTRSDIYVSRGLAWAYLGDKAQAMRDGERGMRRVLEEGGLMALATSVGGFLRGSISW